MNSIKYVVRREILEEQGIVAMVCLESRINIQESIKWIRKTYPNVTIFTWADSAGPGIMYIGEA